MTDPMVRTLSCAAVAASLLLAGCATPREARVTLLPQADGTPSAVVVRSAGGEQRLAAPYDRATARTGDSGPPRVDRASAPDTRTRLAPLFDALPPPPQRYVLYFDSGNTHLTPASARLVPEVVQTALQRQGAEIMVVGHTDTKGRLADNDALALMRARLVERILLQANFPAPRIETAGRGEREPAVPTPDDTDEPRNRRVDIIVR
ncbi:MAG: OmpA family protein [Burkholderiaceae bacterium]|nr:OmpA family protein [Burkholderiaceae bacterium]MDZ4146112.1 OmpA family protein [Burkholderiales bacterium]